MRVLEIILQHFAVVYHIADKTLLDEIVALLAFLQRSAFQFHPCLGEVGTSIVVCFEQEVDVLYHLTETSLTFFRFITSLYKVT